MAFRVRMLVLAGAAFATFPCQAAAQSGTLGLSIGYPTSISVLWQPSATVGIRPEFTFNLFEAESTSVSRLGTSRVSSDTKQVGVGISALFLIYREETLSVYVSPRYLHRRGHITIAQNLPADSFVLGNDDRESRGYAVAGSLGARYGLGARFAVFGEVGIDYSRDHTTEPTSDSRVTTTGIRSGAGVVVFLF
jgi:hypothetical protein